MVRVRVNVILALFLVGCTCSALGTAPLRLMHNTYSPSSVQGILQIYHNGTWGTICNDYWGMTDTLVACKQLGYENAVTHKYLGRRTDPIWLDDVDCNGNESSLDQCQHKGWGDHNCRRSGNVGIVCSNGTAPLRLFRKTSSPLSVQGILQIYHNGQWGTICDDKWGMTETNVACKQLGYGNAARFKYLGLGSGPIWLDKVQCNGGKSSLNQCQHRGWGVHNCSHSNDVGIVCYTEAAPLRLQRIKSSPSFVQGILQIQHNGQWGTICDDNWHMTATNIACKQLGYVKGTTYKYLGQGFGPIWLANVRCNGDESSLDQCGHLGWGVDYCSHNEDVGIVCSTGTPQLRLLGKATSPSFVQGILQIFYNATWGTICSDKWGLTETNIACKHLGYVHRVSYWYLGGVSGPIWLDDVNCYGNESSLDQCQHRGWGVHDCTHSYSKVVGIVCYTGPPVQARMIGDVPNAGRVQLLYKGVWKNLCDSDWDSDVANVICKMAGYPDGSAVYLGHYKGSGEVWLSSYSCTGYEQSIESCRNLNLGQSYCWDNRLAGVVCRSGSPNVAFRLVSGSVPHAGRLEMRYYGSWRSVFLLGYRRPELRLNDVHVICRMMGYNQAITFNKLEDRGIYQVWINCWGFEKTREQCRYFYVGSSDNYWNPDTWIVCEPHAGSRFTVRLMDGASLNEGRVEIGYSGAWGTVSDRYSRWNMTAANIVCRMLGYRNASWAGRARVSGNGFIMRVHKHCTGNETSLEYCEYYPNTYFYPTSLHPYDIGVRCSGHEDQVTLQIRLENGTAPHSGRVSIRYGNSWSTLCYEGLDYSDVKVICRMLGYVYVSHVYVVGTPSSANGHVWLSGIECKGTESSILYCKRTGWWQTTCDFDAVVTCKTPDGSSTGLLVFGIIMGVLIGGALASIGCYALVVWIRDHVMKEREHQRTRNNNPQVEITDLPGTSRITEETSEQQYQELDFPQQHSETNAVSLPSHGSQNQSLIRKKTSQQHELAVATGAGSNTEETSDHEYVDMDSQQQNSETNTVSLPTPNPPVKIT